jgi:hypothetical protein
MPLFAKKKTLNLPVGVEIQSHRTALLPSSRPQRPRADLMTRRPTMRFMVMHYETQAMEDGVRPSPEVQAAIGQYMQEAAMSGVLLTGEGVAPSSEGARVEVADGNVRVIDGPFAEAKGLIAGFTILDVRSVEEAVEHARKFALLVGAERVDVRRVLEVSDFE